MSVFKIFLLILALWSSLIANIAPVPTPKMDRQPVKGLQHVAYWYPIVVLITSAVPLCLELTAKTLNSVPHTPFFDGFMTLFCPLANEAPEKAVAQLHITPSFYLGFLLVLVGTFIRKSCYNELGKSFTYEVTIRKGHTLITSGPYAYLRHPSYLGSLLMPVGMLLCNFSHGSWMIQCMSFGASQTAQLVLLGILLAFWSVAMVPRSLQEDRVLKRHFGKEWEEWASRVRWRIIPGVYQDEEAVRIGIDPN